MPDPGRVGAAGLWSRPGYLVRRLHQLSVAIFHDEMTGLDLTPVQNAALTIVAARPGIEQSVLAEEVGIDRVNVGDVILRLIKYGLVRREVSKRDRRFKEIYLTEEGAQALHESAKRMKNTQKRFMAPLEPEEQKVFLELVMKLIDGLQDQGRTPMRLPRQQDLDQANEALAD
ncbi:MAG TPA: MarR family transcriptional regulator [Stellaceae bacterium]|nr:MarR family transcriptional regulator [Stellaceae bacterium]